MKKKPTRSKLVKDIDALVSKLVRSIGYCQRCGKTENLQCAHIYSRRSMSVRWYLPNLLCLCYACHFHWWHRASPVEVNEWLETVVGRDIIEDVRSRSKESKKYSVAELEELKERFREIDKPLSGLMI